MFVHRRVWLPDAGPAARPTVSGGDDREAEGSASADEEKPSERGLAVRGPAEPGSSVSGRDPSCAPGSGLAPESTLSGLARAEDLVDRASAGVRAAAEVEWAARAAQLYRLAVDDVGRALARDRVLLDEALLLARSGWAR